MYRILLIGVLMLLLSACVSPFARQPVYTETETLFIATEPDPIASPLTKDAARVSVQ